MKDFSKTLRLIYIAFFFAMFTSFNNIIYIKGVNEIILAGFMGVLGAITGFFVFKLIEKSKNSIKLSLLFALFLLMLVGFFINSNQNKKERLLDKENVEISINKLAKIDSLKLKTCEVCGYVAFYPDSEYCLYCFSTEFDFTTNEIKTQKEWIKHEQLYWFSSFVENNKIFFFEPKNDLGFVKDPNWKPSVTTKEVLEFKNNEGALDGSR